MFEQFLGTGQPDAGDIQGGTFNLNGGFWHYRKPYNIYQPVISR